MAKRESIEGKNWWPQAKPVNKRRCPFASQDRAHPMPMPGLFNSARARARVGILSPGASRGHRGPAPEAQGGAQYESKKPLYGILQLGDADANRFLVAIDEPIDGQPKIYIDGKGDGDLMNSGPGNWDRIGSGSYFVGNVVIDVPYSTGKTPYKFCFYRQKNRRPDSLFYYRNSGREGEVVLDDNRYKVLVLDDNSDGRFDDLQNGSLIIDLNQDGDLEALLIRPSISDLTNRSTCTGRCGKWPRCRPMVFPSPCGRPRRMCPSNPT